MPKDLAQHTKAELAVFAMLDAIATTRGLSAFIGFGSTQFALLVDAAAAAEGFAVSTDKHRVNYWNDYVAKRGLQRKLPCT